MVRSRAVAIAAGSVLGAALTAAFAVGGGGGEPVAKLDPTVTFSEPGLATPPKLNGTKLPDGTFTRLAGGEATFASLAGAPAVINFWSQTCTPCVREMPLLDQLATEFGDRVRVVGLNSGDTLNQARRFAEEVDVSYDLWLDDDRRATVALKVNALPVTVFVAADGTIVRTKLGELDEAEARAAVQELLGR